MEGLRNIGGREAGEIFRGHLPGLTEGTTLRRLSRRPQTNGTMSSRNDAGHDDRRGGKARGRRGPQGAGRRRVPHVGRAAGSADAGETAAAETMARALEQGAARIEPKAGSARAGDRLRISVVTPATSAGGPRLASLPKQWTHRRPAEPGAERARVTNALPTDPAVSTHAWRALGAGPVLAPHCSAGLTGQALRVGEDLQARCRIQGRDGPHDDHQVGFPRV